MKSVPCCICHLLPLSSQGETKPYPTIRYPHVQQHWLTYVPRVVQKEKRCVRLCLLLTHSPSFRPSYGRPNLATFSQLQDIPLLEHIMGIGHCWSKRCETLLMSTDNLDVEIPFCLFGRQGLMGEKSWFCTSFALTVKSKQLQPRIKR